MNTTWEGYYYREKEIDQFHETLSVEIARIRSYTMNKWQCMWQKEAHGREIYCFIHEVTFAIRNRSWFVLNRYATYLITGYGPINSTLHKRGLSDTSSCPMCDESDETTDHMIFEYTEYHNYRWTELAEYRNQK